jgi:hypothetical protein
MKTLFVNWLKFLILGVLPALIGIGAIFLLVARHGRQRPQTCISDDILDSFQVTPNVLPTQASTPTTTPTQDSPTQSTEMTPTPVATSSPIPTLTPTHEWMTYDGIDLRNQLIEFLFTMACDQTQVNINPFLVRPYSPELLDSGEFDTNLTFGIAWEHLGFYGLWVHSGQSDRFGDLPVYPLQMYLENNARGFLRSSAELSEHLENCLIGSEMILRQGDMTSVNKVVAAVRISPPQVDEVSRQPMNLVPYLAENYPDSGFDQMELPGLLLYSCGRHLKEESFYTHYNYWTQARYIIGFMPVDEG